MLTYLSGLKGKVKKVIQAKKASPPAKKKLFKKPVSKPKSKAGLKSALKTNKAIIKKISIKKPVLASKIEKFQAQRALKRARTDAETRKLEAETQRQNRKTFSPGRNENSSPSDFDTERFESTQNAEDFDGTIDSEENEEGTELETDFDSDGEISGLSACGYSAISGKFFKKRVEKKLEKQKVKAQKPKNLRKAEKTSGKAEKRKSAGKAKETKAKTGGGAFKDTVKTLVDKGGELLEKQINKRTGGGEYEPEQVPESSGSGIPKPLLYGGLAVLGLGAIGLAIRSSKK
jgi:hypothetical protein